MRGLGLLGLNRVEEAKEQLESAVKLDRNHPGAQLHLDWIEQQG
jgi:Tfp pilus assembly protein PilF